MPCLYGDQPLRIQKTKGGVVHAGSYDEYGGFSQAAWNSITGVREEDIFIPKQKYIRIACSRAYVNLSNYRNLFPQSEKLIDNTAPITCKNCMRLMGLIDDSKDAERFVIINTETGEFYKNTYSRCNSWSESIYDAFFFKRRGVAEDKCRQTVYVVDGKPLGYSEFVRIGRPTHTRERVKRSDMEVKSVKITLE